MNSNQKHVKALDEKYSENCRYLYKWDSKKNNTFDID